MLFENPRWRAVAVFWAGPAIILLAGLIAYHNSFGGELVFDDFGAIRDNRSIRTLWPLTGVLFPAETVVTGRPVANLSFAINYAISGREVWSYHALNLAIHLAAALILFGIVRRTLGQPVLRERFGAAASWLAVTIAVLWTVHPVQTVSVAYLAQRTEELMGLFYLLTLYGFIRAAGLEGSDRRAARGWAALAVAACLLGLGTKEVMVTAPLLVFLYDRVFIGGAFREAWRGRKGMHLALAATWIPFGLLMVDSGLRHRGLGFAGYRDDLGWGDYALTQGRAVLLYLKLSVWPSPLVFDYGGEFVRSLARAAPYLVLLGLLLAGTGVALRRCPPLGFIGCWFFVILAPSSSLVPVLGQAIGENRLYLPLAGIVALAVLGWYRWTGARGAVAWIAVALIFSGLTLRRNQQYLTAVGILSDTVAKSPRNGRAQNNLGDALITAGQPAAAIDHFEAALRLHSSDPEKVQCNLGNALIRVGRIPEAIEHLEIALRIAPDYAEAHNTLGVALCQAGRIREGIEHFRTALRLEPGYAEPRDNLDILRRLGSP